MRRSREPPPCTVLRTVNSGEHEAVAVYYCETRDTRETQTEISESMSLRTCVECACAWSVRASVGVCDTAPNSAEQGRVYRESSSVEIGLRWRCVCVVCGRAAKQAAQTLQTRIHIHVYLCLFSPRARTLPASLHTRSSPIVPSPPDCALCVHTLLDPSLAV